MLQNYAARRKLRPAIHTIRNGPLPSCFKNDLDRKLSKTMVIGCLGNFGGKKAVDVLVKAFAKAVSNGHDLKLILAGDGPEKAMCQRLAEDLQVSNCITWPGWLDDTRDFFSSIDIFCLPSRVEPFGIVVTEAMQAKLPVIATLTDGPRDIVSAKETGWLVPPDDVDALSAAIQDAVSDPGRLRRMGEAGYDKYLSHYSVFAAGAALEAALNLPRLRSS